MNARQLYLWCVENNGLSDHDMEKLSPNQRKLLSRGENGKFWLSRKEREKFTVALTGGAFDLLHMGHIITLREAKKQADLLVVVVATDERVRELKKRPPIHNCEYRTQMVSAIRWVDLAIQGSHDIMETFYRVRPDVVVFGYDQQPMKLPVPVKIVHLKDVVFDEKLAKTSRLLSQLGLGKD
ncbi:MAG: adenylyltransferase/cytidyltransferase family protein [Candidatus Anstonellaceae archaeon]